MQPARLEGDAQRLARAEQVLLADHLVERLRAQPLGQRRGAGGVGEGEFERGWAARRSAAGRTGREARLDSARAERRIAPRDIRCALAPLARRPACMTRPTFAAISSVLVEKFKVDAALIEPATTLEQLGLDSLALMEFVFAVEDRFDVRIPEERLDPRQAGVTLEQLAVLIDEAVAARPGERCRSRLALRRVPGAAALAACTGAGRGEPDRQHARGLRRGALRRTLGGPGRRRSTCRASSCRRCRWRAPISMPRPRSAPSRVPLDRATAMALAAARDAARAAGLAPGGFDPERLGVFWGSGMAGAATFEATCRTVYADRRRMRPTSVVTTMPNAPVAEIALRVRRPRRRPRVCLRLRLVGGGDRRGDARDPRRLDRRRHRRRQRVDADAGRAGELAGDAGARAARRRGEAMRPRGEPAAGRSPPSATASPSARRPRRSCSNRPTHARGARRARSTSTLAGYASNCDGVHITQPDAAGQARAMQRGARRRRPGGDATSATSTPTARRRPPATPPKPNRSPACSAPTACR